MKRNPCYFSQLVTVPEDVLQLNGRDIVAFVINVKCLCVERTAAKALAAYIRT
jgi:hypothetical protein